jgi:hypothetical protein
MGNGDGTFQPPVAYAVYFQPGSVAVADFDRDGFLDVVATNYAGDLGSVSVLLGNGDGTFQPTIDSPAGYGPSDMVVADLNHDRYPDLVVGNIKINDSSLSVLLGVGDGSFEVPKKYPLFGFPRGLASIDFNGDGYRDLAVGQGDRIGVLLANGDGSFQSGRYYQVANGSLSLATGDFDGDRWPDLVAGATFPRTSLSVLIGIGNGTFQPAVIVPTEEHPGHLSVPDANADGPQHLVLSAGWAVSVFLAPGNGTFEPVANYAAGDDIGESASADVDGDGDWDLIVINHGGVLASGEETGSVTVLINDSNGRAFLLAPPPPPFEPMAPEALQPDVDDLPRRAPPARPLVAEQTDVAPESPPGPVAYPAATQEPPDSDVASLEWYGIHDPTHCSQLFKT